VCACVLCTGIVLLHEYKLRKEGRTLCVVAVAAVAVAVVANCWLNLLHKQARKEVVALSVNLGLLLLGVFTNHTTTAGTW